jgi:hypothetical protein
MTDSTYCSMEKTSIQPAAALNLMMPPSPRPFSRHRVGVIVPVVGDGQWASEDLSPAGQEDDNNKSVGQTIGDGGAASSKLVSIPLLSVQTGSNQDPSLADSTSSQRLGYATPQHSTGQFSQDNYDEAIAAWQRAVESQHDELYSCLSQLDSAVRSGDYERASRLKVERDIIKARPLPPMPQRGFGVDSKECQVQDNASAELLEIVKEIMKQQPPAGEKQQRKLENPSHYSCEQVYQFALASARTRADERLGGKGEGGDRGDGGVGMGGEGVCTGGSGVRLPTERFGELFFIL